MSVCKLPIAGWGPAALWLSSPDSREKGRKGNWEVPSGQPEKGGEDRRALLLAVFGVGSRPLLGPLTWSGITASGMWLPFQSLFLPTSLSQCQTHLALLLGSPGCE